MRPSKSTGISIYEFICFDSWGKRSGHVVPRAKGGVAITATDVLFGNCEEEANFLEVNKVRHGHYPSGKSYAILKGRGRLKFWSSLHPKWYPRKFRLSH